MNILEQIEVRTPLPEELEAVRQLRHAELDPDRAIPCELKLGPKDFDLQTVHSAAFLDDQVLSTVRFDRKGDGKYEVRKMVTAQQFRRMGIGRLVFEAAERETIRRGAVEITLDARKQAVPFYASLGYEETGFVVVHSDKIPNYVMYKRIPKA